MFTELWEAMMIGMMRNLEVFGSFFRMRIVSFTMYCCLVNYSSKLIKTVVMIAIAVTDTSMQ